MVIKKAVKNYKIFSKLCILLTFHEKFLAVLYLVSFFFNPSLLYTKNEKQLYDNFISDFIFMVEFLFFNDVIT